MKVASFPCSLRLALPGDSRTHHLFRAWPTSPIRLGMWPPLCFSFLQTRCCSVVHLPSLPHARELRWESSKERWSRPLCLLRARYVMRLKKKKIRSWPRCVSTWLLRRSKAAGCRDGELRGGRTNGAPERAWIFFQMTMASALFGLQCRRR